jgi:hypothetical protein
MQDGPKQEYAGGNTGKLIMEDNTFTLASLANFLKLDYDTVRRMVRQGRIPPPDIKISRFPRWKRQTIQALVAGGKI